MRARQCLSVERGSQDVVDELAIGFKIDARRRRSPASRIPTGRVCGSSYTKYGQNRFACAALRDRGTCKNRLTVRGDDVEIAILAGLKSRLLKPDLFEEFSREFLAEVNRTRRTNSANSERARQELDLMNLQIARLVDAVANGADARALNDKIKELERALPGLETKIADAPASQPLLHPNLSKIYRVKVEQLTKAFRDPDNGREVFDIIRSLISEIRLVPVDGVIAIELTGDLAGILAISAGPTGEGSAVSKALQIKMVAGACNHLDLQLNRLLSALL